MPGVNLICLLVDVSFHTSSDTGRRLQGGPLTKTTKLGTVSYTSAKAPVVVYDRFSPGIFSLAQLDRSKFDNFGRGTTFF